MALQADGPVGKHRDSCRRLVSVVAFHVKRAIVCFWESGFGRWLYRPF